MKKNILIYDDDAEILLLCKAILGKFGFIAETFSRCENILSEINSFQPHLILMDLWIPGIGGEKAIETIKENEATHDIPVLIFSGDVDIKKICKKVNTDGYLAKPFTVSTFIGTIQQHLKDDSGGDNEQ